VDNLILKTLETLYPVEDSPLTPTKLNPISYKITSIEITRPTWFPQEKYQTRPNKYTPKIRPPKLHPKK